MGFLGKLSSHTSERMEKTKIDDDFIGIEGGEMKGLAPVIFLIA